MAKIIILRKNDTTKVSIKCNHQYSKYVNRQKTIRDTLKCEK